MLCGGGGGGAWGSRKREQGGLSKGQHLGQRGLAIGQGGQTGGSGQKTGGAGLWGLCRRSYEPGALQRAGQEVGSTYPLTTLPCLHLAAATHGEQVT